MWNYFATICRLNEHHSPSHLPEWISERPMFFVLLKKIQHKKTTWWIKKKTKTKQNTSGIPEVLFAFPSSPLGYPNLGALDNKPPKAPAAEGGHHLGWGVWIRATTRNKMAHPLGWKQIFLLWGCSPFFAVAFSERVFKIRMENYVTQFRLGNKLIEKLQRRQCGISPVKASNMNVTWSKCDCKMIGSN